jgi:hypothetical protein
MLFSKLKNKVRNWVIDLMNWMCIVGLVIISAILLSTEFMELDKRPIVVYSCAELLVIIAMTMVAFKRT